MLYKFAGSSKSAKALGESSGKARAASPAEAAATGSPRWNRRAEESSYFTQKFPLSHGTGIKLGPDITILALLIQGPFPTEDNDE